MANALLAYRNRADTATLSGGSWAATLPVSNLTNRLLSKVGRSTSAAEASTQFSVALDAGHTISVAALCRHNFSYTATWRLTAYSDAGFTAPIYDSGILQVWGPSMDSLQLEWQNDNFWSGRPSADDIEGYYWNAIHILTSNIASRYWKVDVYDASNPAGYVEVGRLFLSEAWTPAFNMSYGAALGYSSRTEIEESWDGTEYFDRKPTFRTAQFRLENMNTSEAMTRALDMQRLAGVDKEVLFIWDTDDVQHLMRRSFLGRVRESNPIEQPYYESHQTSYVIKELL